MFFCCTEALRGNACYCSAFSGTIFICQACRHKLAGSKIDNMFRVTVGFAMINLQPFFPSVIHIRMISEGSCDTEDWCNNAENSALHHRKKNTF